MQSKKSLSLLLLLKTAQIVRVDVDIKLCLFFVDAYNEAFQIDIISK